MVKSEPRIKKRLEGRKEFLPSKKSQNIASGARGLHERS
jgi:hypothetical protein